MKTAIFIFFLFISLFVSSQEICNNGIDDDNDGKIDLNDSLECICGTGTPTITPSIIPNPSFENMTYCPSTYSQLDAATGWLQATAATSDYFNTCGYNLGATNSLPLLPFPDGNGIVGAFIFQDYKEYIGSCLLSPMVAGTGYKINFNLALIPTDVTGAFDFCTGGPIYDPIDITLFGKTSCPTFPITITGGATGYECPSSIDPSWTVLGTVTYTPSASWILASISFTPSTNVNSIILGSPCNLPSSYPTNGGSASCYPYLLFDNLRLNDASQFPTIAITKTGHHCTNNLVLTANITNTVSSAASSQWYLNGIAILGATSYTYNVPSGAVGNYQFQLTDGSNCFLSPIEIVSNSSLPLGVSSPALCAGTSTIVSAYCSFSPTAFSWNTGATTNTISVSPANTTTYTVTATYGSCTGQATATVTIIQTPTISISGNTNICAGQSATLTVSGGSHPFDFYYWDDGFTFTLDNYFNDTVIATPSITTTYTLYFEDYYGCYNNSIGIPITVNVGTNFSIPVNSPTICTGQSTLLTATGATNYTWTPSGINTNTISVSPTSTTIYTVQGDNGSSCSGTGTSTVTVINPMLSVNSPTICSGESVILTASGGTSYTWSPSGATTATISVSPNSTSAYTITGLSSGCLSSYTSAVIVTPLPSSLFSASEGNTVTVGTTINFINNSINGVNYLWDFDDINSSQNTSTLTSPSHTFADTGIYCIQLIAINNLCKDTTENCVVVTDVASVVIPNVFTPNNDGSNEVFKIVATNIKTLNVAIYDRWGLKLKEWNTINGFWDGRTTSGQLASAGTYFYTLEYVDFTDKKTDTKGFITLIRD